MLIMAPTEEFGLVRAEETFPFFELPRELRDKVYGNLKCQGASVCKSFHRQR